MSKMIPSVLLVLGCKAPLNDVAEVAPTPSCLDIETPRSWERLGSPVPTAGDGHFAPSLVAVGDALWLYYAQRDNLEDTLFRLTSVDGESWTAPVPVQGFDGFTEIKQLSVQPSAGGFSALLGGGSIADAFSADGLSWTLVDSDIVAHLDFDRLGQLYPVRSAAADRIWYSGFDGATFSVGLATRENELWSSYGPVIERDPGARYDNTAAAQSALLEIQERYLMFYGGYDTSQTDPGPWRILTATSSDGLAWEKNGLELDILPEGEEAWSVREPSVAIWKNTLWMAYIAMGEDGAYRSKLARCVSD